MQTTKATEHTDTDATPITYTHFRLLMDIEKPPQQISIFMFFRMLRFHKDAYKNT